MPDAPENNEYFQMQQDKGEVSLDFQGVEVHTLLYQKKYVTQFLAVPCHLRKTTAMQRFPAPEGVETTESLEKKKKK